jgi:hypothetical protein
MFKLTETADLEKAGRSIANFIASQVADLEKSRENLEKNYTFHKAAAAHHEGLAKAHADAAATHKAAHDGLDDGDMHKTAHAALAIHHQTMSTHHDGLAKLHAAHADTMKAAADSVKADVDNKKAFAAEWGATVATQVTKAANGTAIVVPAGGMEEKFQSVTEALVAKALESIAQSPKIHEMMENFALDHVNKLLGSKISDKLIPDQVRSIIPPSEAYGSALTAVPRTGQPAMNTEKVEVPLEFEHLVKVE